MNCAVGLLETEYASKADHVLANGKAGKIHAFSIKEKLNKRQNE